jgi:hypothetical protein
MVLHRTFFGCADEVAGHGVIADGVLGLRIGVKHQVAGLIHHDLPGAPDASLLLCRAWLPLSRSTLTYVTGVVRRHHVGLSGRDRVRPPRHAGTDGAALPSSRSTVSAPTGRSAPAAPQNTAGPADHRRTGGDDRVDVRRTSRCDPRPQAGRTWGLLRTLEATGLLALADQGVTRAQANH